MCDIHQSLRIALAKKNISQTKMASEIGVSRFHISNMCNGRRVPSWGAILDICDVCEVKVSKLVAWGEE